MEFDKRIRAARKAAGLSQEALARRADVSAQSVRQLEQGGVYDPHYSTVSKIAQGLGMPVSELLGEPAYAEEEVGAPKVEASLPSESEERRYEVELAVAERAKGEAVQIRERIEQNRAHAEQLLGAQDSTDVVVVAELRAMSSRVSELGDIAATRRETWQDERLDPARIEGRPEYVMQPLEGVLAEFLAAEQQASSLGERLQEALDDERIERTRSLVQEEEQAGRLGKAGAAD